LQSLNVSANSLLQTANQSLNAIVAIYLNGINTTVQKAESCLNTLDVTNIVNCVTQIANVAITTETSTVQIKINTVKQILKQIVNIIVGLTAQPPNATIPSTEQTIQSAVCQIGSITQQATSCLLQAANATAANATAANGTTANGTAANATALS
jgi:hypothetical protein